jgi:hypothetical protein
VSQLRDGIIRYASRRPGKSSAWCTAERAYLCEDVSPRKAGADARKHTRDTGHQTIARHIQTVSYRPEET